METKIRYALLEDYEDILLIMQQVVTLHAQWRPDIFKKTGDVLPFDFYNKIVNGKNILVFEENKKIAGFIIFLVRHIEDDILSERNILFIDTLAVDEQYRGQGVGRQLLASVKMIKEKEHYDGIELQVNAKNINARKMYEACGFSEQSIYMELL